MAKMPLFEEINRLLEEVGAYLGASEAQGLLCGYSTLQADLPRPWLGTLLQDADNATAKKVKTMIQALFELSQKQLASFNFELEMLLPSDKQPLFDRAEALAMWCQGYLLGLDMGRGKTPLNLSPETKEALDELKQIAKLELEDEVDEESEQAYLELAEFVKLTAITVFTELNARTQNTYH